MSKKGCTDTRFSVGTFAYADGGPPDSTLPGTAVIDCRGLPNPWKRRGLKDLPGDDPRMLAYFMEQAPLEVELLMSKARDAVLGGKTRILFGCLHGRHRSVAMAREFERRSIGACMSDLASTSRRPTCLPSLPDTMIIEKVPVAEWYKYFSCGGAFPKDIFATIVPRFPGIGSEDVLLKPLDPGTSYPVRLMVSCGESCWDQTMSDRPTDSDAHHPFFPMDNATWISTPRVRTRVCFRRAVWWNGIGRYEDARLWRLTYVLLIRQHPSLIAVLHAFREFGKRLTWPPYTDAPHAESDGLAPVPSTGH